MQPIYIAAIVIACAALLILVGAVIVYLSNSWLKTVSYTLQSQKVRTEGVKIVLLSDLHAKRFGEGNRRLIEKVAVQRPDFIAITGDIIHKYKEKQMAVAVELVRALTKVAPVFFVSGNHEMRSTTYRFFKEELKQVGAIIPEGESVEICGINLCGINCADVKKGGFFKLPIYPDKYNLLLVHLPQYITRYSQAGFDAVLCGHAHGGQWRLPFGDFGFYSPGQGLFPKYTSGVHSCGDMRQVISRGLGNSECPIRIFNRPEIVVVNLVQG